MWDYSEKVMDHFLRPRNVGEIENPDAEGTVGNMACGDALKLMLRLDENGRIADAKFQTFGCASAIASSSALTEMIRGKTLDEALEVTNEDIAEYLGGLPEAKMHCSVMGRDALEAAVAAYRGEEFTPHEEGEIVCRCFGVTDDKIERVIRENGLKTVDEVTHYCKAGGGCGTCIPDIEKILERVNRPDLAEEPASKKPEEGKPLTNVRKMKLVMDTIEKEVRPMLRSDGGDIELVDIIGDRVLISFRGACSGCPVSGFTLKEGVEKKLREFVSDAIVVEEVPA